MKLNFWQWLGLILLILLFPFYWMALTAVKPNDQLLNLDKFNPFWTWSPTLSHVHKLLFDSLYPQWLWNTMYVAVAATVISGVMRRTVTRRCCCRACGCVHRMRSRLRIPPRGIRSCTANCTRPGLPRCWSSRAIPSPPLGHSGIFTSSPPSGK